MNASNFLLATDAIFAGDVHALERLIAEGLDLHREGPHGNSLLRNAASFRSPDPLIVLLRAGANPNHRTNYRSPVDKRLEAGFTPLMYADTPEVVKALIEHGADVNLASDAGITPLMRAGTAEIATLLLAHGAKLEATNQAGSTALMFAIQWAYQDVVACLLQHGADPNVKQVYRRGKKTYTPRRLAEEAVKTWSKFTPEQLGKGGRARLERSKAILQMLIDAGAR